MMKSLIAALFTLSGAAVAAPAIDAPAPAFLVATSSGETISFDQFKGKTIILEWSNDGSPFVQKHYETGNMQATQKAANKLDVVWITVISSAPGKQGHADAVRANRLTAERGAEPDFVLLYEDGSVGKAFGAKTTPQMALIDQAGAHSLLVLRELRRIQRLCIAAVRKKHGARKSSGVGFTRVTWAARGASRRPAV